MTDLLIDVTRITGRALKGRLPTGIDRVCLEYLRAYGPVARAVLHRGPLRVVLPEGPSRRLFQALQSPGTPLWPVLVPAVAQALGRRRPPGGGIVLNLGHSGLEDPGYARWLAARQLRPVVMVHDLIPVTHPEFCRPRERDRHGRRLLTVLDRAAGILTNSTSTLLDLESFARAQGRQLPPAIAAPLAAAPLATGLTTPPLAEPYFVVLSTIEPRKNHATLLRAWRRLLERHGTRTPRLVIIGQRGWECDQATDLLDRCPALRPVVLERPRCADAELVAWLTHARALLFPSFVEGFGLPLLEALALGVPALASDLAVFRETAGGVPEYLDPLDGPAWLDRVEDYSRPDSAARSAQLARLAGYTAPTWTAHFARFEELLGQVA